MVKLTLDIDPMPFVLYGTTVPYILIPVLYSMASSLLTADISIREAAAEVCRLKNALENAEKVLQNAIAIRQRACVAFSSADRSAGYVSSATRLTIEECYDWPALMKRAKVDYLCFQRLCHIICFFVHEMRILGGNRRAGPIGCRCRCLTFATIAMGSTVV
jgi:hypothetical protein